MKYGLIQTVVISDCDIKIFTDKDIRAFLYCLVNHIGMKVADIENPCQIWEDHTPEEDFKKGVSANIFIETSNISVHACDPQKTIRISIFTCKDHDIHKAAHYCESYWKGTCIQNMAQIVY